MITKICGQCGKEFQTYEAWLRNGNAGKYCSKACSAKAIPRTPKQQVTLICHECGKTYEVKPYRKDISLYCSKECRRKNMPKWDTHPNWKGGKSKRTRSIIKAAIKRDGKCSECGSTKNLTGHHIKFASEYPELEADIDNIMTLCDKCHARIHLTLAGMIVRPRTRNGTTINCVVCGNEMYVTQSQTKKKYCSTKCKSISQMKGSDCHG